MVHSSTLQFFVFPVWQGYEGEIKLCLPVVHSGVQRIEGAPSYSFRLSMLDMAQLKKYLACMCLGCFKNDLIGDNQRLLERVSEQTERGLLVMVDLSWDSGSAPALPRLPVGERAKNASEVNM
ncbi:hypothetical protein ABEF95_009604 [Exophiala dermatitidis]|uniref:Uncharacterized protein n=1 Tax=Exophiala dermatitidis (strain ATCC 34100 / CBS 525.76 / NIH/UT8656) TaxID=858893 RepID=H6CA52_EXODN|nr:uncharacterized protein HMPREF1120_07992 [Exophiala dermatitidis NIH/UT8656]EHY60017.1 hypothetical protein HMPREF1120_07992 [Exophiala dermatitidis NIH/UT8656]